MLKKILLGAAASATAIAAFPTSADAQRYGEHDRFYGGHHERGYDRDDRFYARRYYPRYRGYGYYAPAYYGPAYYGAAYYEPVYYGPAYYSRPYYRGYGYRCGPSPDGAIVGGAIGALVGHEIGRGGYRYHRGGGAAGAILGGAAGAIIGSEVGARC